MRIAPSPRQRPLQVIRHHSDFGHWQITIGTPDPGLAAYVAGYWGYADSGMRVTRRRKARPAM